MLTLLRNADVFDPRPLGRRDVLVCAGRVVAVEPALEVPRQVACEVLDVAGMALVPGLLDAHVHLGGGGGESGFASRVPPLFFSALTTAGVTTVVGLLGTDTTTRSIEDLVARAYGLREEGLSAYCWTGGYAVPPCTLTGSVRRDIVFCDPVIGCGETAISDHRSSQPTLEEIVRLAADCHVAGLTTKKAGVLHLHLGDGTRGLDLVRRALETTELPARTFHPTHVNRRAALWEEARHLARERGVVVDVTAFPIEEGDEALAADVAVEAWLDARLPTLGLTLSSDGGGCLPTFDADGRVASMDVGRPSMLEGTLRALLGRGRALADVLPFFTSNVARVLRLERKGQVRVDADADLIVLAPGGFIRHVMARGRMVVREGEPVVRGAFERSAEATRRAEPTGFPGVPGETECPHE